MNRLTKEQRKQLETPKDAIECKHLLLQQAIEVYNAAMAAERAKVEEALEVYNGECCDFEQFREDLHGDMEAYADERSESWQEGDAGQAHSEWRGQWEDSLEATEIEFPDDLEVPETAADKLDELPEECGC